MIQQQTKTPASSRNASWIGYVVSILDNNCKSGSVQPLTNIEIISIAGTRKRGIRGVYMRQSCDSWEM